MSPYRFETGNSRAAIALCALMLSLPSFAFASAPKAADRKMSPPKTPRIHAAVVHHVQRHRSPAELKRQRMMAIEARDHDLT